MKSLLEDQKYEWRFVSTLARGAGIDIRTSRAILIATGEVMFSKDSKRARLMTRT